MRIPVLAIAAAIVLGSLVSGAPAQYRSGPLPALPAMVLGGGEVFLEVAVDRAGQVIAIAPLRSTVPFTSLMIDAVNQWVFVPAEEPSDKGKVTASSRVLVVGIFRRPAFYAPTLGELPEDVGRPSDAIPFPLTTTLPPYPPLAHGGGVSLLEAQVDVDGSVAAIRVMRPAPPFDAAARAAIRQWRFRPACVRGRLVSTTVYLVFGFPPPVLNSARATYRRSKRPVFFTRWMR